MKPHNIYHSTEWTAGTLEEKNMISLCLYRQRRAIYDMNKSLDRERVYEFQDHAEAKNELLKRMAA